MLCSLSNSRFSQTQLAPVCLSSPSDSLVFSCSGRLFFCFFFCSWSAVAPTCTCSFNFVLFVLLVCCLSFLVWKVCVLVWSTSSSCSSVKTSSFQLLGFYNLMHFLSPSGSVTFVPRSEALAVSNACCCALLVYSFLPPFKVFLIYFPRRRCYLREGS